MDRGHTRSRRWSGFPARPVRAGVGYRRARRRNAHHGAVRRCTHRNDHGRLAARRGSRRDARLLRARGAAGTGRRRAHLHSPARARRRCKPSGGRHLRPVHLLLRAQGRCGAARAVGQGLRAQHGAHPAGRCRHGRTVSRLRRSAHPRGVSRRVRRVDRVQRRTLGR